MMGMTTTAAISSYARRKEKRRRLRSGLLLFCARCKDPIPPTRRSDSKYCTQSCRAAAEKKRQRARDPEKHRRYLREWNQKRVYGRIIGDNPLNHTKNRFRAAQALGYRSGLEVAIAKQLKDAGIEFLYEAFRIPFVQPEKNRHYTPDVILPNGIIIESKGRFVTADRQKHLLVKAQQPDLDIRFVFSNSRTRISKASKTTYALWCQAKGFLFDDVSIPSEWLNERVNRRSLSAIQKLMGGT